MKVPLSAGFEVAGIGKLTIPADFQWKSSSFQFVFVGKGFGPPV
jgi:hypothetical protein